MTSRRPSQIIIDNDALVQRLMGNEQEWLAQCRSALAAGTTAWLLEDGIRTLEGGAFAESAGTSALEIATACAELTAALANGTVTPAHLTPVLIALENGRPISVPSGSKSAWPDVAGKLPNLSQVLAVIHYRRENHQSAGFTALLARYLAGEEFKTYREADLPVLFDQGGNNGSVGHLRLQVLKNGPPGVHADPRQMTFLTVDGEFNSALRDAWTHSKHYNRDTCIIWSLTDAKTQAPVRHVTGASLGAAWAVALDELAPRPFVRKLRKKLDPSCAVTARIDGSNLESVSGYENKIAAAGQRQLRVVLPKHDVTSVTLAAGQANVDLRGAVTLADAIKATRTKPNALAITVMIVVGALITGALTAGFIYSGRLSTSETQRLAADMVNTARAVQSTDPRKAALLALASDRLAPGGSEQAMVDIVNANQMVAATYKVSDHAVRQLEATGGQLFALTSDHMLSAWDSKTGTKEWSFGVESAVSFTIKHDGSALAISDGANLKLYDVSGDVPVLQKSVPLEYGTQVLKVTYTPEAPVEPALIIVTAEDIQTRDPASGALRKSVPLSTGTTTEPEVRATVAGSWHGIGNTSVGLFLAMSDNRILDWPLGSATTAEVISAHKINGQIYAVRDFAGTGMSVAVATDEGIVMVASDTHSVTSIDFGGTSQALDFAGIFNGTDTGIAVLRDNGIVYIPGTHGDPRFSVTIERTGAAQPTSITSDTNRVFAGDMSGNVTVIDALHGTSSRRSLTPSSAATFTPRGDLIRSDMAASGGGPMNIARLERLDVSAEGDSSGRLPEKASYYTSSFLDDEPMYVNEVVATDRYVAAGGQTKQGTGVVLVWDVETGAPIKRIDFDGSRSTDASLKDLPDIVTQVSFVDGGRQLVAYNLRSGVLAAWSTTDWNKISDLNVGRENPSFDVRADDKEILILTENIAKRIDVDTLKVTSATDVGDSLGIWYISSSEFVSLDSARSLSVRSGPDFQIIQRKNLAVPSSKVSVSPSGEHLALLQQNGTVEVLSRSELAPVRPRLVSPWGGTSVLAAWNADGNLLATLGRVNSTSGVQPTRMSLWSLDPAAWHADLCTIAGSELTDAEWQEASKGAGERPTLCPATKGGQVSERPNVTPSSGSELDAYGKEVAPAGQHSTEMITINPWSPTSLPRTTAQLVPANSRIGCSPYPHREGPQVFRCGEGPGNAELCYPNPASVKDFLCLFSRDLKVQPTLYTGVETTLKSPTNEADRKPIAFLLQSGELCVRSTSGLAFLPPKGYTGPIAYCPDGSTLHSSADAPNNPDSFGLGTNETGLLLIAKTDISTSQISLVGVATSYY